MARMKDAEYYKTTMLQKCNGIDLFLCGGAACVDEFEDHWLNSEAYLLIVSTCGHSAYTLLSKLNSFDWRK